MSAETIEITMNKTLRSEPCIIQSAFKFKNGIRIMVYTGKMGITTHICDKNWKVEEKPYATVPKEHMHTTPTQYHLEIRKRNGEESLVKEHSTNIDWI